MISAYEYRVYFDNASAFQPFLVFWLKNDFLMSIVVIIENPHSNTGLNLYIVVKFDAMYYWYDLLLYIAK